MNIKFKYFSCKSGHAVPRFGTDVFIGAIKQSGGFIWDEDKIAAIPESEVLRYKREYDRAIRDGSLISRTQVDYDKYIGSVRTVEEDTAEPAEDSEDKPDITSVKMRSDVKRKKAGGRK